MVNTLFWCSKPGHGTQALGWGRLLGRAGLLARPIKIRSSGFYFPVMVHPEKKDRQSIYYRLWWVETRGVIISRYKFDPFPSSKLTPEVPFPLCPRPLSPSSACLAPFLNHHRPPPPSPLSTQPPPSRKDAKADHLGAVFISAPNQGRSSGRFPRAAGEKSQVPSPQLGVVPYYYTILSFIVR